MSRKVSLRIPGPLWVWLSAKAGSRTVSGVSGLPQRGSIRHKQRQWEPFLARQRCIAGSGVVVALPVLSLRKKQRGRSG